ncbi:hypothetical protein ACFFRL_02700 [Agromyces hippuratus]|uniref:hypothetical protein n=1 Tax=Agromyces hippuratus TaxID=286438 RepID=UPI0035E5FFB5
MDEQSVPTSLQSTPPGSWRGAAGWLTQLNAEHRGRSVRVLLHVDPSDSALGASHVKNPTL